MNVGVLLPWRVDERLIIQFVVHLVEADVQVDGQKPDSAEGSVFERMLVVTPTVDILDNLVHWLQLFRVKVADFVNGIRIVFVACDFLGNLTDGHAAGCENGFQSGLRVVAERTSAVLDVAQIAHQLRVILACHIMGSVRHGVSGLQMGVRSPSLVSCGMVSENVFGVLSDNLLFIGAHNGSAFLPAGFLGGRFSGFRWPVEFKNVFLIQGFALQGHDGFMRAHAMLADDQCSSV